MPVSIPIGARTDSSSFKSVADEIDSYFAEVGEKVGRNFSKELADGMSSSEKDIQRSASKVARSYDRVADATGKVRSEQEKLNQLQDSGARNDRLVTQTERLEKARRDESRAIRQTISDLNAYEKAAEDAADAAQRGLGSGIQAGFGRSIVGRFMADLRSEGEASGSMTGVLIGRAVGAGVTAGLAAATAGVAAIIGGVGYTITKGFQRLQGIDQAEFKLKALGHSGAEVSSIMKDAETSVKGTAFALDEAVGAAASAVAAGIDPGKDLAGYLTTIGDAAAVAGTSFDEMASIFNKVTTSNKAYTQELRQLADRGIPIFTWLQDAYKVTGDELDKMVKNGAVDAETFRNVVAANIGGAAKEMGQSFSGAVDNLQAAVARLGAAAIGVPFDNAAGSIEALTGKLDEMKSWLSDNQDKVIDFWTKVGQAAIWSAQSVVKAVADATRAIAQLVNFFGDAAGGIVKANSMLLRVLGQTDEANKWSDAAEDLFGLADGMYTAADAADKSVDTMSDWMDNLGQWGDKAKLAAQFTKALGDSTAKVGDHGIVSVDMPSGPSDVRTRLNQLGFKVQQGTDGGYSLTPTTDEATKTLEAWREKQAGDGVSVPVRPDFTATPGAGGDGGGGGKGGSGPRLPGAPVVAYDPSVLPPGIPGMPRTAAMASVESSYIDAHQKLAEKRARLQQLEGATNATADDILKAKNDVAKAERDQQQAEMRLSEARQKQLEQMTQTGQKQTKLLGSLTSQLGDIGAQLDSDFGISKGLAGIAENITKFLAGLAFAPMMGALSAISQANPIQGGHGLMGILGAQNMAARGIFSNVGSGSMGDMGYAAAALGPAALQPYPGGGNVAAMMALAQASSGRVKYAPASDLVNGLADCSGSISDLVEMLQTGKTSPGRLFTTTNFASDAEAAKLGFLPGYMPGALNVGVNPYPGQSGHMAATLPNGVAFEGGGGTGGGAQYGGPAVGALDPQFEKHYYMPVGPAPAMSAGPQYAPSYAPSYAPTGPSYAAPGPAYGPSPGPTPTSAPFPNPGGGTAFTGVQKGGIAYPAGPGGEGFAGVGGLPLQGIMTAAQGLDLLAPGASQAAQVGIQLANRAIGYAGQVAGIGVGGLMETFLPSGSPLASIGNSWIGRLASGFAGASPALPNMAGQQAPPLQGGQDGQQQPGQQQGDTNITVNNNRATEDGTGRDVSRHLQMMHQAPGR